MTDRVEVRVTECDRCGRDHLQVDLFPLINSDKWWYICPLVGQPNIVEYSDGTENADRPADGSGG